MTKKLKIAIIGCGAIGGSLAKAIVEDFSRESELVALYDKVPLKAGDLSKRVCKKKNLAVKDLKELINKAELVIEAASAKSSWEIAQQVLAKKRNIMIMSVGGVIDRLKELKGLAGKNNSRVYIPSGAVCGIDALKAVSLKKIKKVLLTTRKNPLSFKGNEYLASKGIDLSKIKKDTILFQGPAKEAVKLFPQNINVASVLSIAGIGENKTQVRIIACPSVGKNIHEVTIDSEAATIFTRAENILHPLNPKTSFLAALSAIAVLKQILEPVKIGT
ncbi:MAG: aspartate dehydrogenase [Candidatus Omnitrophica bacterium]|nr:aspartate dehydrogenase [Candidatus Omnitrophota bacterium]